MGLIRTPYRLVGRVPRPEGQDSRDEGPGRPRAPGRPPSRTRAYHAPWPPTPCSPRPGTCFPTRWRSAGRAAPAAGGRPRPPVHPGRGAVRHRRVATHGAHGRLNLVGGGHPRRRPAGADGPPPGRHGRVADARGHRPRYGSELDGTMHACGHDTHVAMLAATARLLSARRDELTGRVVFMFQPGEEGFHGARYMLDEDLLDVGPLPDGSESPVTGAFALHISSMFPSGTINLRGGTLMASAVLRFVRPRPRRPRVGAAPGPRPHPGRLRDRAGHPDDDHPAHRRVRSGCRDRGPINAGTTSNVIPETAEILGTIRAVSERTRTPACTANCSGSPRASPPPTMPPPRSRWSSGTRSPSTTSATPASPRKWRPTCFGGERVTTMRNPVMGAEDFSYVLQRVPGALAFLGAASGRGPAAGRAQPLQPGRVRRGRHGPGQCAVARRTRWRHLGAPGHDVSRTGQVSPSCSKPPR